MTSEIVLVTDFQPDSLAEDQITWRYELSAITRDAGDQIRPGRAIFLQRSAPAGMQTLMMGGYLSTLASVDPVAGPLAFGSEANNSQSGGARLGVMEHRSQISWGEPVDVTPAALKYVSEAPPVEAPNRLAYFARFLEDADQTVSNDAYGEFAKAPYEVIVPIAKSMSANKLRAWLTNPKTPQGRIGLYGMMLGLCGDKSDVQNLNARILSLDDESRPGINGLTAGYLMLAGEPGLDLIEKKILSNPDATLNDLYPRVQAVEFLLKYADGRVSRSRLEKSLYPLIAHPALGEQVITTLSRWKDWSAQERVFAAFADAPEPRRKVIIRYFLAAARDKTPEATRTAARIEELKKLDPALVKKVLNDPFQNLLLNAQK